MIGQYYFRRGVILIAKVVPYEESPLRQRALDQHEAPISRTMDMELDKTLAWRGISALTNTFRSWSLLPAVVAISLCLLTKNLSSLLQEWLLRIYLGDFNLLDGSNSSICGSNSASILLLYLWLLGFIRSLVKNQTHRNSPSSWRIILFVAQGQLNLLAGCSVGVLPRRQY